MKNKNKHSINDSSIPFQELEPASQVVYRTALALSLILIVVLLMGTAITSRSVSHQLAYKHLIDQLEVGSLSNQELALRSFQANTAPGWLTSILVAVGLVSQDTNIVTVRNVYNIISRISANDFVSASQIYLERVKPNVFDLLQMLNMHANERASLHALMKHADQWSHNIGLLAQLEINTPAQIQITENKEQQMTILAQDIVVDFHNLLGFTASRNITQQKLTFYQSGVLKGLPQIERVPDNIKNLTDLKTVLDEIGVSPQVSGGNVAKVFAEKLADLKKSAITFQEELEKLGKNKEQMNESLASLRLSVYQDSQTIKNDLLQMLKLFSNG